MPTRDAAPDGAREHPVIYLDSAATTPLDPAVLEAMTPYLTSLYGNASSVHGVGRRARAAVDDARDRVAAALDCDSSEVLFLSGGSEADNLALRGACAARPACHVLTVATEHHAVMETARALEAAGHPLTVLPVDHHGHVDAAQFRDALRPDTGIVSVMLANNEVGTVQDLAPLIRVTRERSDALFHTDAVQAVGKLPVSFRDLGVDLLTLTAHKLHGPKGAGALLVRRGARLTPMITGGAHEREMRAGTENVAGIVGLGCAVELAVSRLPEMAQIARRRDRLMRGVQEIGDVHVTGDSVRRVPTIASFVIAGVQGEDLVLALDMAGLCASGGAACAAGSTEPSHVIAALGIPEPLSLSPLRLSLSRLTSDEEIDEAGRIVAGAIEGLRAGRTVASAV